MEENRKPVSGLVAKAVELLALINDGRARIDEKPDDVFAIQSAFVLLNSPRD